MTSQAITSRTLGTAALIASALLTLAACGSSGASSSAVNSADRAFLAQMIPHHERAIETARVAQTSATDPRVRAFAQRVLREQSPELATMQSEAKGLDLNLGRGADRAMHRISDGQLNSLESRKGAAFDRQYISLNIYSENGAHRMAKIELAGGNAPGPKKVALGISHSPSEIAELKTLLTQLS